MGVPLLALVGVLLAACGGPEPAPPDPPGSRFQAAPEREIGIAWGLDMPLYTDEQANAGGEVFGQICSFCHSLAEFRSPEFHGMWTGSTLGDLYGYITSSMPRDNPGALEAEQYAAVLSFLLRENGVPAGSEELAADRTRLREFRLERPGQ